MLPSFEKVSLLCAPYDERDKFWYINTDTAPGCTLLDSTEAAYGDRVCDAPMPANTSSEALASSPTFQVRVTQHVPLWLAHRFAS